MILTMRRFTVSKSAALHYHPTVEVFMPASGKWAVFWGDDAENEIFLEPLDVVSVPPGVMRGFRNAGNETGVLIAILGGTNAGRVTWHPKVLEAAKKTPLRLDEYGNVERTS
jgi:mannose-6-phosphate isomerase-like protein (cupin superfamily)